MKINIIAAVSDNGVIGKNGALPWHIPEDMKRFRELTTGNTVVMGRKTFESLGSKALPDRVNYVLTSAIDAFFMRMYISKVTYCKTFNVLLREIKLENKNAWIIGGENIYKEFMPHAQRMYITRVHQTIENGDAFFPEIDLNIWHLEHVEKHDGFDFEVYSK